MPQKEMSRAQLLAFAREIVEHTGLGEGEILRIARLVQNCEMSLSGFMNAMHLHYMNYYLSRDDIIRYLLSQGYEPEDEIFSKDFPQKWIVDDKNRKIRTAEYLEFDEHVRYVFEADSEYIKECREKGGRDCPGVRERDKNGDRAKSG